MPSWPAFKYAVQPKGDVSVHPSGQSNCVAPRQAPKEGDPGPTPGSPTAKSPRTNHGQRKPAGPDYLRPPRRLPSGFRRRHLKAADQSLSEAAPVIRLLHAAQGGRHVGSGAVAVQRMDNVGIVVEDLPAAVAFFRELGLELEGQGTIEGEWSGRVTGWPTRRGRHDAHTGRSQPTRVVSVSHAASDR